MSAEEGKPDEPVDPAYRDAIDWAYRTGGWNGGWDNLVAWHNRERSVAVEKFLDYLTTTLTLWTLLGFAVVIYKVWFS